MKTERPKVMQLSDALFSYCFNTQNPKQNQSTEMISFCYKNRQFYILCEEPLIHHFLHFTKVGALIFQFASSSISSSFRRFIFLDK